MKPNAITQTIDLGNGRVITIETGVLAKQADGSVLVRQGDNVLLATVVSAPEVKDGVDFMPLTVDYREKYASTGRFPGGFFKREARPSDYEVLIMRLVDRALRPLFPDDYHADTQVMISLLSSDGETMPDALACLAASAAIAVSDVPFSGPVSEVRIGRVDGQFIVNPTKSQLEVSDIDIIVAGSAKDIVMVEGETKEIGENDFLQAIHIAHEAIKQQCAAQNELASKVGSLGKVREYCHETHDEELKKAVFDFCYPKCYEISSRGIANKEERKKLIKEVRDAFVETLPEDQREEKSKFLKGYFYKAEKEAMRRVVLEKGIRLDGRKTTEIRPIWCETNYLPSPHGSALFTRGETQALATVTLGTKLDEQMIDGAFISGTERFLLHYNFPPFSTGESSPLRGTSRREVGHGNLALRALRPMLPETDFPYTTRIVSDVLESNGSSSMATVCAGTLALLDAGVKMKRPVSGIAMGLITDNQGKYVILSDILGDEDHLGDMDFKVTGTRNGITACQMDIKIDGLSHTMLSEALEQARQGRLHILEIIEQAIPAAREDYKPHVPRIISIEVPQEVIGAIIGPGGKIIQEIQKTTNTIIVIEEINGKGVVEIAAKNKDDMKAAETRVRNIAFPRVVEIGEVYDGKVKTIMPYGAFVELIPGIDGLLHVSEIDWTRIENVSDVLKEGDVVQIKVLGKDPKTGKLKLSRRVLLEKPETANQQ